METGDVTSLFLYLGNEIMLSRQLNAPLALPFEERAPRCPFDAMLGRSKSQRGLSGVETNLIPLSGYQPPDRPSRSFVTIPTALHRYVSGDGQFCNLLACLLTYSMVQSPS